MEQVGFFLVFILIILLAGWFLATSRRRQAKRLLEVPDTAEAAGLSSSRPIIDTAEGSHSPVASFHVRGEEIQVTFDVPLPAEPDQVLYDLLLEEAIEVARDKRHTLPIDQATTVVAYAGRGEAREVARAKLPSPGELPPRVEHGGINLAHVAHDPFAAPFDEEQERVADFQVRSDTPEDELGPLAASLRLPAGLERGLRATGVDPSSADASQLILALLRMFGYTVSEHAFPGSYMAVKDGKSTYIQAEAHARGESHEVSEASIRRFLTDFNSSGAERGLLLSEKYAPFEIHSIEARQPKVRFVTRERIQRFIDSMALG
jgi:hypothetical protein